jgi:Uri superfamily endonuclease
MTGAYLLILFNPKRQKLKVGKLGKIDFDKGYYFYVGSGMKNLEQRVLRHQRKDKKIKWHIDYLTRKFKFIDSKLFPSSKRLECQIAKTLGNNLTMIKGFGCSDCRCQSHLFYSPKIVPFNKT